MVTTLKHHVYDDCSITFVLFQDLKNAKDIRQSVITGEFEATLLKTSMIADPFHVTVAANRAIHLHKTEKMTTKNVHSEVLFCLSPSKNISDSFRKFGMSDSDESVFVVILNDSDGKVLETVKAKVDGTVAAVDQVTKFTDVPALQKIYKVTDLELSTSSLNDVITAKIASKEFVTI